MNLYDNKEDINDEQLYFETEYLFIKTAKEKFSDFSKDLQNVILKTKNIHIYQINKIPFVFDITLNSNIYIYTFNVIMEESCLSNGYIPHFCFLGNDIHNKQRIIELHELLLIDQSIEVFWFPSDNNVTESIEPFMDIIGQLKFINHPICISFSDIFNSPIDDNKYSFLKKIYTAYSNPLLIKELELLEYETFSNKNYFIDDTKSTKMQHIILGIYGDQVLNDEDDIAQIPNISKKNLQNIAGCLKCPNFNFCSDRGIGIIAQKNNLKKCLGISLLNS